MEAAQGENLLTAPAPPFERRWTFHADRSALAFVLYVSDCSIVESVSYGRTTPGKIKISGAGKAAVKAAAATEARATDNLDSMELGQLPVGQARITQQQQTKETYR